MLSEQHTEIIKKNVGEIWELLTLEQQEFVLQSMIVQVFKRGDVLFSKGQKPEFLFILMDGFVKVVHQIGENQQIVRIIKKGECFGYGAHYCDFMYMNIGVAQSNCLIGMLSVDALDYLLMSNPKTLHRVIFRLTTLVRNANHHMTVLTKKNLRGRLANVLIGMLDYVGTETDGQTLAIYLTREEMANLSNMNTGNCIRTLSAFAQEGLLAVDGRSITLLDVPRLRSIAIEE